MALSVYTVIDQFSFLVIHGDISVGFSHFIPICRKSSTYHILLFTIYGPINQMTHILAYFIPTNSW